MRSDGSVSDYSREVLADLDRRGVPVVIVTARPIRWMDDLWPIVGQHGLAIVSNGAAVVDVAADEVRDVQGIDPAVGLRMIEAVRRRGARGVVRRRVREPVSLRDRALRRDRARSRRAAPSAT